MDDGRDPEIPVDGPPAEFRGGSSAMVAEGERDHALYRLYETFLQLTGKCPPDYAALITEVLMQNASQQVLQLACANVMKNKAHRREYRDDVLQEANLNVSERFSKGQFEFTDQGFDRFRGWLWTIWHHACRDAWAKYRPRRDTRSYEDLTHIPANAESNEDRWPNVLRAIRRIADPLLRQILDDWATGMSCVESSRQCGISRSVIGELRQEAFSQIREILDASD